MKPCYRIPLRLKTLALVLAAPITSSCIPLLSAIDRTITPSSEGGPVALQAILAGAMAPAAGAASGPGFVAVPSFSPAPGSYAMNSTVSITSATPGATIYYTTDGSPPGASSSIYTIPVSIGSDGGITLRAIAVKAGLLDSAEGSGVYTIDLTPPTVASTAPENNATGVTPMGATITVVFSEAMNTTITPALTTQAFNGSTWQNIPNTGTALTWTNPTTLTIVFSWNRLPENTQLRWTLGSAGLTDANGITITGNVQRTFTTTWNNTPYPAGNFTGPTAHITYTSDHTTTDSNSGLIWKTCSEGLSGADCSNGAASIFTWYAAVNACAHLNTANGGAGYAGRIDWRLPDHMELMTLLQTFGSAAFPNTKPGKYWSRSSQSAGGSTVWAVDFSLPVPDESWGSGTDSNYIHCVAGP